MIWLMGCRWRLEFGEKRDEKQGEPRERERDEFVFRFLFFSLSPLPLLALTMKISLTKKPMKPMTTKPSAVLEVILVNSGVAGEEGDGVEEEGRRGG